MIIINRNGMVKTEIAKQTGLPIFDFTTDEETGIEMDYCSRKELASYGIMLNQYEQENFIVGFLKDKNFRGVLPLYSLQQMLSRIAD